MGRFVFRGCRRCGGDLFVNQGDWQCLQCGRYPQAQRSQTQRPLPAVASEFWAFWQRHSCDSAGDPASNPPSAPPPRWHGCAGEKII